MSLGVPELLFILVAALIFVGPRRLPEIGRQVGRALAQFKQAKEGFVSEIMGETSAVSAPSAAPASGAEAIHEVSAAVKAALEEETAVTGDSTNFSKPQADVLEVV